VTHRRTCPLCRFEVRVNNAANCFQFHINESSFSWSGRTHSTAGATELPTLAFFEALPYSVHTAVGSTTVRNSIWSTAGATELPTLALFEALPYSVHTAVGSTTVRNST
jgi:hypothetical protein